jgi:hypothetical protein
VPERHEVALLQSAPLGRPQRLSVVLHVPEVQTRAPVAALHTPPLAPVGMRALLATFGKQTLEAVLHHCDAVHCMSVVHAVVHVPVATSHMVPVGCPTQSAPVVHLPHAPPLHHGLDVVGHVWVAPV